MLLTCHTIATSPVNFGQPGVAQFCLPTTHLLPYNSPTLPTIVFPFFDGVSRLCFCGFLFCIVLCGVVKGRFPSLAFRGRTRFLFGKPRPKFAVWRGVGKELLLPWFPGHCGFSWNLNPHPHYQPAAELRRWNTVVIPVLLLPGQTEKEQVGCLVCLLPAASSTCTGHGLRTPISPRFHAHLDRDKPDHSMPWWRKTTATFPSVLGHYYLLLPLLPMTLLCA